MLLNHREESNCLFFFGVSIHHRFFDQLRQLYPAARREICRCCSFQLPQMQNRRATLPLRHISSLIEGSLADRFSNLLKERRFVTRLWRRADVLRFVQDHELRSEFVQILEIPVATVFSPAAHFSVSRR
jgi:hypothetical protein